MGRLSKLLCFSISFSAKKNGYIYPRGEMTILPLGQFKVSKGSQGKNWYFPPISLIIINALQFPLFSIISNTNNSHLVTL